MKTKTLQELIESRISLGKESAKGFRVLRCQVCNNECMSRDSVRQLLHAMADHLADTMELEDERPQGS